MPWHDSYHFHQKIATDATTRSRSLVHFSFPALINWIYFLHHHHHSCWLCRRTIDPNKFPHSFNILRWLMVDRQRLTLEGRRRRRGWSTFTFLLTSIILLGFVFLYFDLFGQGMRRRGINWRWPCTWHIYLRIRTLCTHGHQEMRCHQGRYNCIISRWKKKTQKMYRREYTIHIAPFCLRCVSSLQAKLPYLFSVEKQRIRYNTPTHTLPLSEMQFAGVCKYYENLLRNNANERRSRNWFVCERQNKLSDTFRFIFAFFVGFVLYPSTHTLLAGGSCDFQLRLYCFPFYLYIRWREEDFSIQLFLLPLLLHFLLAGWYGMKMVA